jgi:hydroxypyruvate reductase
VDAARVTARLLDDVRGDLERAGPLRLVAAGKAARGMSAAVEAALGDRVIAGVVTVPDDVPHGSRWESIRASHPVPGTGSEAAGLRALELARASAAGGGLLLVCLSGGASAMLAAPAPGLTIADKAAASRTLLAAGLPIDELNLVRRHLSAIKGGRLAAEAGRSLTLAISDVCVPLLDEAATIGSGPTVADASTARDACGVLERRGLLAAMPAAVVSHLGQPPGAAPATRGGAAPGAAFWTVASRHDAMRASAATARRLGYDTVVLEPAITGPARDGWRPLLAAASSCARPGCVIASGETTVRVIGPGRGGRNQELAAAALEPIAGAHAWALASVGTDGIDGPTDAAGGFVDSTMWAALGPDARGICDDVLARHDSYVLLDRLGALVRTGPTGTNVADLMVLLLADG